MKLNTDFAFEGFRLMAKKPMTTFVWIVFYSLLTILPMVIAYFVSEYELDSTIIKDGWQQGLILLAAVIAGIFAFFVYLYLWGQSVASVIRAVLRPQDTGFFYFKRDHQPWRIVGVNILTGFLFALIMLGLAIPVLIFVGISSLFDNRLVTIIFGVIAGAGFICFAIYALCRLSLNVPQTFADNRINVMGSWKLAEGNVGALFLGYLILFVVGLLLLLLACAVVLATGMIIDTYSFDQVRETIWTNVQDSDFNSVTSLAYHIVIEGLFGAIANIVSIAATAAAYQQLAVKPSAPKAFFDEPEPTSPTNE